MPPQMPAGMPPQMPAGMPPQGMPPQQMFSGGIIRLQEGGFLDREFTSSRPGPYNRSTVRESIEDALARGASMADLLAIFKNQPEAIELVKELVAGRQQASASQYNPLLDALPAPPSRESAEVTAQRRQPDMSLLSPVEVMAQRKDLPDQSSEGLASLGAMTGILPPEYDQQVAERRAGFAEYLGDLSDQFAESRARDREFLNRRSAPTSAPESKPANVQGDSPIQAQAVSGQGGDPILANILGLDLVDPYMPDRILGDEPIKPELAQEEAPEPITIALDALTNTPGPDASNPKREPPPDREPSLDFADLIAESKKAGMANALMQLGAGIAGGDLSKGISAAGIAATKGQQDAKAIAMQKRLAEYQAGREDIARAEKGRQFDEQMDLLEQKVDATLAASSATSERENLRALAGEVASLRENFALMSDAEKARFKVLEQQLYSMLGISMPQGDVVAGLSGKDKQGLSAFLN